MNSEECKHEKTLDFIHNYQNATLRLGWKDKFLQRFLTCVCFPPLPHQEDEQITQLYSSVSSSSSKKYNSELNGEIKTD